MTKWKVGITGGIGSGKSFCARIFQQLGVSVYYADERAQRLMIAHPDVRKGLIQLLGSKVYNSDDTLNKELLREKVFKVPLLREKINNIVHPAVESDYVEWHNEQSGPYTLKEAALMVESGSYRNLDCLLLVETPLSLRIQRIMVRDKISSAVVQDRMISQMPEEQKKDFADLIIDNSGCYSLLPQIIELHKRFIKYDE